MANIIHLITTSFYFQKNLSQVCDVLVMSQSHFLSSHLVQVPWKVRTPNNVIVISQNDIQYIFFFFFIDK